MSNGWERLILTPPHRLLGISISRTPSTPTRLDEGTRRNRFPGWGGPSEFRQLREPAWPRSPLKNAKHSHSIHIELVCFHRPQAESSALLQPGFPPCNSRWLWASAIECICQPQEAVPPACCKKHLIPCKVCIKRPGEHGYFISASISDWTDFENGGKSSDGVDYLLTNRLEVWRL